MQLCEQHHLLATYTHTQTCTTHKQRETQRERERERERIYSVAAVTLISPELWLRMLPSLLHLHEDAGAVRGGRRRAHRAAWNHPYLVGYPVPSVSQTYKNYGSRCWIIWADLFCMPPFLLLVSCISCCFGKSRGDSHSKGIGYGHHSTMRPLSPWLLLTQRMLPASLIFDQHLVSQQQLATSDGESTISTSTAWIQGARKSSRRHLQPHGWRAPPMEQRGAGAATPKVWSR